MNESLDPAALTLDPEWLADTVAVQAGRPARVPGAPMNAPITLSSTYVHDATIEYGRDGNAGWSALETALGALDGGRAVTFASGLAAATAIADLVPAGGTVVLSSVTYYGVRNIFERMAARGRLHVRLARPGSFERMLGGLQSPPCQRGLAVGLDDPQAQIEQPLPHLRLHRLRPRRRRARSSRRYRPGRTRWWRHGHTSSSA